MTTFTKEQLLSHAPCKDGLKFAESCDFDFEKIYDICERGDWLIWLLRNPKRLTNLKPLCWRASALNTFYPSMKISIRPTNVLVRRLKWLLFGQKNPTEKNLKAAADAADVERKWQANKIRELIPNPFK